MLAFTVPGPPVAKGRARVGMIAGKARMFTPSATVAYEGLIALAAEKAMDGAEPYLGPVSLSVTATFAIPASWTGKKKAAALWHTGRPDGDNLLKAVGDGLNGIAFKDDSQVASARIIKCYGAVPGLTVEVEAL
ncbi:hypothetical protein TomTYG75_06990 [Sphingobium sp. TomTYG75]